MDAEAYAAWVAWIRKSRLAAFPVWGAFRGTSKPNENPLSVACEKTTLGPAPPAPIVVCMQFIALLSATIWATPVSRTKHMHSEHFRQGRNRGVPLHASATETQSCQVSKPWSRYAPCLTPAQWHSRVLHTATYGSMPCMCSKTPWSVSTCSRAAAVRLLCYFWHCEEH